MNRFPSKLMQWRLRLTLSLLHAAHTGLAKVRLDHLGEGLLINRLRSEYLFDRNFYVSSYPEVQASGLSPLRHYIRYGDKAGLSPSPLFDVNYYRSQRKRALQQGALNSLLHYLHVGRYQKLRPCRWFDPAYYLAHSPDVVEARIEPLWHYINHGGKEGRSPCPEFDGNYYLQHNPDVSEAGLNPLMHYLTQGYLEGRKIKSATTGFIDVSGEDLAEIPKPQLPAETVWRKLPSRVSKTASVDVIVPVYKGLAETLSCLYSVLIAANEVDYCLLVINDASPDEKLSRLLRQLSQDGLFVLLENSTNLGFVGTVNRGMQCHTERDVVLLNSDTEVYDYWLDRMVQAAAKHPKAATLTPLSNNATICSYPRFVHDNPIPLEIDYAELDHLAADVNAGWVVSAPSGVGFCFYIRWAALDEVGLFDEVNFGKGYGEENDFCQRAEKSGWENLILANVFVRHWGSASFQGEKEERVQHALKTIDRLHPEYHQTVDRFIKQDPLAEARERLDWARLERFSSEKNVLIIAHSRGGGTERHVQEDVQRFSRLGYGVFFIRPHPNLPTHIRIAHSQARQLDNLPLIALADTEAFCDLLGRLSITEIHTHGLVDFVVEAPALLSHAIQRYKKLGHKLHWEVNIHDYKVICPRITLTDQHGRYCGEPEASQCNQCLRERSSSFNMYDISYWRELHKEALYLADKVSVPDVDVSSRLQRYFPDLSCYVEPHEPPGDFDLDVKLFGHVRSAKLKVVIIGAISKHKGFEVLLETARYVRKKQLPVEFVVLGYSMQDSLLESAGVYVSGAYAEMDALSLLSEMKPDIVWLPSLWPETYSYTLSIALRAGLPVMAFDIGAIARRLRAIGQGKLLIPLACADNPAKIIKYLSENYPEFYMSQTAAT